MMERQTSPGRMFGVVERAPCDEAARIGVFICHCGHNIGGYLDVPRLVESARMLPQVVWAQDHLFTCSDSGLAEMRSAVHDHDLNRVVVASCTPRTHEALFQAACEEAGLNRYLFEFVNIRDQCSWVHMGDTQRATEKAADLIRMGVAKAFLLEPLEEAELVVRPAAAVIGGGMAGMTVSLSLARRGFAVTLIEQQPELGGMLRRVGRLYPTGADAHQLVEQTVAELNSQPGIEVFSSAEVREVRGTIGNYELVVHSRTFGMDLPVQAGIIVVAIGAEELKPDGFYGYGDLPHVRTQGELESQMAKEALPSDLRSVVMIQCVGARDSARPYCGRTCCLTAIKNAVRLRERDPGIQVYVLYRDIEAYGTGFEDFYAHARDMGVIFTRFTPHNPPEVTADRVVVYDDMLGARLGIPYDLLVLSTPMVPRAGARELAQMLKVPVDEYGFFLEAHVKLRPLDFATDGVYLCGSAHWPAHLDEVISQAYGAAARAATILSKEQIRASGVVARVNEYLCRGCLRCADVCEFGAVELEEKEGASGLSLRPSLMGGAARPKPVRTVARVNAVLCKGCGACAVVCPTGAMQASYFTSRQLAAMILASLGG